MNERDKKRLSNIEQATKRLHRKLETARHNNDGDLIRRIELRLGEFKTTVANIKGGKPDIDVLAHASLPVGVDISLAAKRNR